MKNWQNDSMALRWGAAGIVEASKQFRRVNSHLHLPALRIALDQHVASETVGTVSHNELVIVTITRTATEVQRLAGQLSRAFALLMFGEE